MDRKALRLMLAVLAGVSVGAVSGIINWPGTALATPSFQFNSETLSQSFFRKIEVETETDTEEVEIEAEGRSGFDVYVVRNKVPPGGYSGWHTHPGPSVVSVKSGTATVYSGDDPYCTPVRYPAGKGFIDEGGGHVHMVRNEGSVELEVVAFQIIPAGALRRIDAPSPGNCPF